MKDGSGTDKQWTGGVPEEAKQAGETQGRWSWVEPVVWTERMLTALEQGVKGGRWFSLIDKVYSMKTLRVAWRRVKANKGSAGVDHQTIEMFEERLEENLARVSEQLREETYRPQAIRRCYIPKAGSREKRPLGIPTVRDRVVQTALKLVLEPIFERDFAERSYGFRPERSCRDALRQVYGHLKEEYHWVVDADLKSYFDTISHEGLMRCVEQQIADGRVLRLIRAFLEAEVMETLKGWTPEEGAPQGAVISPLLSNIYLNALDHQMAANGIVMVRYADDFVLLCQSGQQAQWALNEVQRWTDVHDLTLHPDKTRIVDASQRGGFDFLGYHFERGYKWPRKKSLKKFKDTIRRHTRRSNGHSLEQIISNVNRTLIGWFGYFKHSHYTTFKPLDGWTRMRLRSILRKRRGGRGRGRGRDHNRWQNDFFADRGLFSLAEAYEKACESARAVNRQLESRVRETRMHGSEGGGAG